MLKHYEMVLIVHPNVPEEETSTVTDRLTALITQQKGEVVRLEKWGKKKLSYKIKKCNKGYYFLLNFLATPTLLTELERVLRYDENILRFQTVKVGLEEVEALRTQGQKESKEEAQVGELPEEASPEG